MIPPQKIGVLLLTILLLGGPATAVPGPVRLMMPPVLYATPGVEANLYFENLILAVNPANYAFDVDCDRGYQQSERWTFTPAAEDVGSYPISLKVIDGTNAVIAEGTSTIVVTPAEPLADRPVSLLAIGDSLTHASIYTQALLDHAARPGTPALTLVGSHAPKDDPANRHEGYGGWTAWRFATHYTGAGREAPFSEWGSPFLYKNDAGETSLDFARYCNDHNGGVAPELVTIFLGCNDVFGAKDDTLEATVDDIFAHMDALIGMIRSFDADTRIGLIAPVPPASSQDAFGANYKNGQTRWQYLKNQHRLLERMTETYGGRKDENISLLPAYVNLDCRRNYPVASIPANARTEVEVPRQYDSVHPGDTGYRQIGDSIYAWMLATMAK